MYTSRFRLDKQISIEKALAYATQTVNELSLRDVFMIGLAIYIGEGSKVPGIIRVSNSDPRIIKFSIIWFKKCFGLSNENFHVRIHAYPDTDQILSLNFWQTELGLTESSFLAFSIDKRMGKNTAKAGSLPHGTAHLTVVSNGQKEFGILLHRKILATMDRILNSGISLMVE